MPSGSDSTEEDEGFVASWKKWFLEQADDQRKDRLSECRELEAILAACRKRRQRFVELEKQSLKLGEENPMSSRSYIRENDRMEESFVGQRLMKYFGWRGVLLPTEDEMEGEEDLPVPDTDSLRTAIAYSCAREQHALWACRSMALGCASHMSPLRECFRQCDPDDPKASMYKVIAQGATNYEGKRTKDTVVVCPDLQYALGSCVNKEAKKLLEREEKRKK